MFKFCRNKHVIARWFMAHKFAFQTILFVSNYPLSWRPRRAFFHRKLNRILHLASYFIFYIHILHHILFIIFWHHIIIFILSFIFCIWRLANKNPVHFYKHNTTIYSYVLLIQHFQIRVFDEACNVEFPENFLFERSFKSNLSCISTILPVKKKLTFIRSIR